MPERTTPEPVDIDPSRPYIKGTQLALHRLVAEIADGRSIMDIATEHDVDPTLFKKALEDLAARIQRDMREAA